MYETSDIILLPKVGSGHFPLKRQGWLKERFDLFQEKKQTCVQRPTLRTDKWARTSIGEGMGATCRQSIVNSDNHLEIGHAVV